MPHPFADYYVIIRGTEGNWSSLLAFREIVQEAGVEEARQGFSRSSFGWQCHLDFTLRSVGLKGNELVGRPHWLSSISHLWWDLSQPVSRLGTFACILCVRVFGRQWDTIQELPYCTTPGVAIYATLQPIWMAALELFSEWLRPYSVILALPTRKPIAWSHGQRTDSQMAS